MSQTQHWYLSINIIVPFDLVKPICVFADCMSIYSQTCVLLRIITGGRMQYNPEVPENS